MIDVGKLREKIQSSADFTVEFSDAERTYLLDVLDKAGAVALIYKGDVGRLIPPATKDFERMKDDLEAARLENAELRSILSLRKMSGPVGHG